MASHARSRSLEKQLHRGQTFGYWTVIRRVMDPTFIYSPNRDRSARRRSTAWYLVQCTCGREEKLRRCDILEAKDRESCRHPVLAERRLVEDNRPNADKAAAQREMLDRGRLTSDELANPPEEMSQATRIECVKTLLRAGVAPEVAARAYSIAVPHAYLLKGIIDSEHKVEA